MATLHPWIRYLSLFQMGSRIRKLPRWALERRMLRSKPISFTPTPRRVRTALGSSSSKAATALQRSRCSQSQKFQCRRRARSISIRLSLNRIMQLPAKQALASRIQHAEALLHSLSAVKRRQTATKSTATRRCNKNSSLHNTSTSRMRQAWPPQVRTRMAWDTRA